MKKAINSDFLAVSGCVTRCLAIFLLLCSFGAQATAPRITPKLFGEEKKSDIAGYQTTPFDAQVEAENAMIVELVAAAYKATGKAPVIDVLPSKQLASYALFNGDVAAMIGSAGDLAEMEKSKYRQITFYLRPAGDEPVMLIFSKSRGDELYQSFNGGLQKILKNGKYSETVEKYHGKGFVSVGYFSRLKRHNPGWK